MLNSCYNAILDEISSEKQVENTEEKGKAIELVKKLKIEPQESPNLRSSKIDEDIKIQHCAALKIQCTHL